jgi:hypothetical protein
MRTNPPLRLFIGIFALTAFATPVAAQQSDNQAISAADRAFYAALSSRDLKGMEAVWAHKPYVSLVGPRSKTRTLGYDAVVDRKHLTSLLITLVAKHRRASCPMVKARFKSGGFVLGSAKLITGGSALS